MNRQGLFEGVENILCVWRSKPSVVVGRNQNHFKECNFPFLIEHEIDFARRDSGGGTVFQDERNLNFCFIRRESANIQNNLKAVCDILSDMGKSCTIDEKHNIRFQGDKVSGSAFRYRQGVELHHFTLLLESDLTTLRAAIHPQHGLRIYDKSIQSQRSTVTNLGLDIEDIYAHLPSFCDEKNIWRLDEIDMLDFDEERLKDECERLRSDEWRFGKSPNFAIEFSLEELFCEEENSRTHIDNRMYSLHLRQGKAISLICEDEKIWEGDIKMFPMKKNFKQKNDCYGIMMDVLPAVQKKLFGG